MNTDMIRILREELARRMSVNPRYSMRAFAKSLDLNVGSLSRLLNGKRPVTLKTAEVLSHRLQLSPLQKSHLLLSLVSTPTSKYEENRVEIEEETFRAISNWYHWAILQLVRTKKYNSNSQHSSPRWMARQLKISELEAKMAVERLLELGLLTLSKTGFYKRTSKNFSTADKKTTSAALKSWQKQLREKAIFSLENDPIEVRSMTSMTMAIDPKKISEAKKMIDEFQERLAEFLESGSKEKVYQMCVSLFPIQTMEN